MAYHGSVTRTALENAIKPEHLRITTIIQLALMAGPVVFSCMVLLMVVQQQELQGTGAEGDDLWLLTIAHLGLAVVSFLAGQLLMQWRIAQFRTSEDMSNDTAVTLAEKCLGLHRAVTLLRLAPMEGAAFFGLCVCVIAVVRGALPAEPKYWINLASTALLVIYGALTLPSKERIGDLFDRVYGI